MTDAHAADKQSLQESRISTTNIALEQVAIIGRRMA